MRTIDIVNACTDPGVKTEIAQAMPFMRDALHDSAHHFAQVWDERVPVVKVVNALGGTGWHIVITENPDVANALGYHDVGPDGRPYARVFTDPILNNGGDILRGDLSVMMTADHEFKEVLLDPLANGWSYDGSSNMLVAQEACDPVQSDAYETRVGTIGGGATVTLSNFVTPNYFNPFAKAQFDMMGVLTAPFSIARGGYIIYARLSSEGTKFGRVYQGDPNPRRQVGDAHSRYLLRSRGVGDVALDDQYLD